MLVLSQSPTRAWTDCTVATHAAPQDIDSSDLIDENNALGGDHFQVVCNVTSVASR
jgi:hypothetical protein